MDRWPGVVQFGSPQLDEGGAIMLGEFSQYRWREKLSGFTLIELLVIVGGIAILTTMLLPGLVKAKERTGQAVCMSNLKRLGIATAMYTQEWEGFLPYSESYGPWFGKLSTYFQQNREVTRCPSQPTPLPRTWEGVTYLISYSDNVKISYYPTISRIPDPANVLWLCDGYTRGEKGGASWFVIAEASNSNTGWPVMFGDRHNGLGDILFLDGHVGALPLSKMSDDLLIPGG